MKKVKYRAYNYIIDSIYKVKSIDWDDIGNLYHINGITVDPTQVTLMQFTGLHDKNGKEIYEGDIVHTTFPHCNAIVTWETETVRFIGYTIESERKIIYIDRIDKNDKSAVEVIGNIYDNPELLESEE